MAIKIYAYRALFEPGDRRGVIVVSFPDVPEAITEGRGGAEARAMAADALGLALLAYVREGRALPAASRGKGASISAAPDVAARLARFSKRRAYRTEDATTAVIDAVERAEMDAEHAHLDELLK